MDKVNLRQKFTLFSDQWSPRIVGEANGQYIKLAKVEGDFVWHQHDHEDELFLVVDGLLHIDFQDGSTVTLAPGEFTIVPKGTQHRPHADVETHLVLIEPKATTHTGDTLTERTVAVEDQHWI